MKSYTKEYLKYFGYGLEDFIPCEICNSKAVDIHHIEARSKHKNLLNNIDNLMALCRNCHIKFGDKKQYKDMLKREHKRVIEWKSLNI